MRHTHLFMRFLGGLLLSGGLLSTTALAQTYQYDNLNRLIQATYPTGESIRYHYDAAGNLLSVRSGLSDAYRLTGQVTEAYTQRPLAGVVLSLGNLSVTTDANGNFEFTHVIAGNQQLTARLEHYQFDPQSLDINADTEIHLTGVSKQTVCVLYAVHDEDRRDSQFFVVSPIGNYPVALLGGLHLGEDIEALDIHPSTDTLFAAAGDDGSRSGWLYTVDPQDGALTPIGSTGFNAINGLSFSADGQLWGWADGDGLLQIDTVTGAGTLVIPYAGKVEDMTWNLDDTVLYFVRRNTFHAYYPDRQQVEPLNCAIPAGEIEAIEMLPSNELLFAIHNDAAMGIYALDPLTCQVVSTYAETQTTGINLDDVEGIAWPTQICGGE